MDTGGRRPADHGMAQVALSILHEVSVSPGGEKSAYSAGWCPRLGLNSSCSHGLLLGGPLRCSPALSRTAPWVGPRRGCPHRASQILVLGWACPLHKGGAWPLAHPAVSTDAPRVLAEAPHLPCPVLLTSCLLGPPGKGPVPHSDGPPSAPGACCQGPGTHSLPGAGAPQGLALGWGPRGSAGGGRGEHVGWQLPWWLAGGPSVRGRPPSLAWVGGPTDHSAFPGVGQGPPGRRGTADPSGQHSRPGSPEPWVGEVPCLHQDPARASLGAACPLRWAVSLP